jgi:hypothetical protein
MALYGEDIGGRRLGIKKEVSVTVVFDVLDDILLIFPIRYSDFDRLHTNLVRSFPHAANMIPDLPRKSLVSRFRPEFLESRRKGLQHFLKYVKFNLDSPQMKANSVDDVAAYC